MPRRHRSRKHESGILDHIEEETSKGDSILSSLDIKFLTHVVVEVIIVAVVVFYFYRRSSYLEQMVRTMEAEMTEMKKGMIQMSSALNTLIGEHNSGGNGGQSAVVPQMCPMPASQPRQESSRGNHNQNNTQEVAARRVTHISAPPPTEFMESTTGSSSGGGAMAPPAGGNPLASLIGNLMGGEGGIDLNNLPGLIQGVMGKGSPIMEGLSMVDSATSMAKDAEEEYLSTIADEKGKEEEYPSDKEEEVNQFEESMIVLDEDIQRQVIEELQSLESSTGQ